MKGSTWSIVGPVVPHSTREDGCDPGYFPVSLEYASLPSFLLVCVSFLKDNPRVCIIDDKRRNYALMRLE